MSREQCLLATIEKLYEAAWDASEWPAALARYAELSGGRGAQVLLIERATGAALLGIVSGYPEEGNLEYVTRYAPLDERIPRMLALPLGETRQQDQLYRDEERRRSVIYNEFLCKYGAEEMAIAHLAGPPGTDILLSSMRGRRIGAYRSEELALAQRAFPHVERAVALSRHVRELDLERRAALDALDMAPCGIALLSESGKIIAINRRARRIASRGDGLVARRGRLSALRRIDHAALQRLTGGAIAAARGNSVSGGGSMSVRRPSGVAAYAVLVAPVPMRETLFAELRPAASVFIRDPEEAPRLRADVIAAAYDLTPSEARLACALATGEALANYTRRAGIGMETARTHLKSIFRKTDTHSQVELVRQMLLTFAPLPDP